MTLKDWIDFNEPVLNQGDMLITINKEGSHKTDGKILPETLMKNEAACMMFGDLELKRVQVAAANDDYHTLRCLLWKKA